MSDTLKRPVVFTNPHGFVMATQSAQGQHQPGEYRDAAWITVSWFGNDAVTLMVGTPLLIAAARRARQGSTVGLLWWLGAIAYAAYNYAFYLFGAALNAFFLLYVAAFVLSAATLLLALPRVDIARVAATFRSTTPVRVIGGAFTLLGLGLMSTWITMWAAYAFAGRPTPVEPEAFKVVAALDLSLMGPALALGGILLWRRAAWGYLISAIAGIQGSLYLLVLVCNSIVAVHRGLVYSPGEIPVWGTLAAFTAGATLLLLTNVRPWDSQA
jgi:hypothetical protein